jgi:hypothetical protein
LLILLHHPHLVKFPKLTKTQKSNIFHLLIVHPPLPAPIVRTKNKEDDKRLNEERIRCESDLKRIYIYGTRAIQTQDQTNLNRYALVKGKRKLFFFNKRKRTLFHISAGLELFAQHATLFTEYLYDDYPEILRCIRAWNAHDNYDVKKIAQRAYDTFLLGVRMTIG